MNEYLTHMKMSIPEELLKDIESSIPKSKVLAVLCLYRALEESSEDESVKLAYRTAFFHLREMLR